MAVRHISPEVAEQHMRALFALAAEVEKNVPGPQVVAAFFAKCRDGALAVAAAKATDKTVEQVIDQQRKLMALSDEMPAGSTPLEIAEEALRRGIVQDDDSDRPEVLLDRPLLS